MISLVLDKDDLLQNQAARNQKVCDNQNQSQNQRKIIKKDFWLYTHN